MKVNDLFNENELIENYKDFLANVWDMDINNLSNQNLQFLKLVSASSISTMKQKGKDNYYILTHSQGVCSPENKEKKERKIKNYLSNMDTEALRKLMESVGINVIG